VELYWLLNGKGSFPSMHSSEPSSIDKKETTSGFLKTTDENLHLPSSSKDVSIERIVIFYKDGTFKNFEHL
ncbi:MAG: transcriptional regulator, partial [Aquaticitalea sp.]